MLKLTDLKPLQRQALLAALQSPTHTLQRMGRSYVAAGAQSTSGPRSVDAFTPRLMNMLERDGLVDFDPPMWPVRVTLRPEGLRLAEELQAAHKAKAGVA